MSFRIFPFVLSDIVSAKPRRKPVPPTLAGFQSLFEFLRYHCATSLNNIMKKL